MSIEIPKEIEETLKRYVEDRIETGGFLRAVLSNDLYLAAMRADPVNRHLLVDITLYVWHELPMECRGTPEKVAAWLGKGEI